MKCAMSVGWNCCAPDKCESWMPRGCRHAQVVSLHGLGRPLTGCCAASYGTSLVVYSTKCAPGEIPTPKAYWQVRPTEGKWSWRLP